MLVIEVPCDFLSGPISETAAVAGLVWCNAPPRVGEIALPGEIQSNVSLPPNSKAGSCTSAGSLTPAKFL